ncbi:hypothetical protein ACGFY3_01420 [Streptomyces mirabilis]|uniref:hypothetical protein n=1 Tax=Streptomyces mirabilis TaxID=68239 RepID=UPI003711B6D7
MFVDWQLPAEHEECPDPVLSQYREFTVLVDLVSFGNDLVKGFALYAARTVLSGRPTALVVHRRTRPAVGSGRCRATPQGQDRR